MRKQLKISNAIYIFKPTEEKNGWQKLFSPIEIRKKKKEKKNWKTKFV